MADKIQLQVDLKSHLEAAKSQYNSLDKKNAIDSKTKQSVTGIISELESLSKIANPTLKNLSRFDALFNQLSEILLKAAGRVEQVTENFKNLEKELLKQQKVEKAKQSQRGQILKEGRINKDTGQYELFKTFQTETVTKANIKNTKGVQIKNIDTFLKKFDEAGNPLENSFQDPVAAKAVYDELKKKQQENARVLEQLTTELNKCANEITRITKEMEQEGKKSGDDALSSSIYSTKIDVNRTIESGKEAIHENANAQNATAPVEGVTQALQKQTSVLGRAFKSFTIYNLAIKATKTALNEAKRTVQELDKYLTEQAMVTGKSREETYKLVKSYQALAIQCGATTKEIASVATEYMKQGKTIEDSLVLTEAAVKAAKVARVSVGDSVNYLTTALNGFRLSTEDAMKVSDKFAAVAASSATDYDELAIALSKVASQANLAGMSIDYTTALLTKGLETTREAPETMGTALKTIIARMRELGDYGETLDDGMDINNVESQLKYVGIALRDSNGELRSTEDVLDELGKKWDTLNKNQQAAIAKALAGTRQQSRLIAMMEDYERVTELQEISARSAGATTAQAATYLEGMEAAMNKIQVSWEKIVMNLTNSELVIGVFDLIGDSLDKIGDMLDSTGSQVLLFGSLGTILLSMLGHRLRENEIAKEIAQVEKERLVDQQKAYIESEKKALLDKETAMQQRQSDEADIATNQIKTTQKEYEIALQDYLIKKKEEERLQTEQNKITQDIANEAKLMALKEEEALQLGLYKLELQSKEAQGTLTAEEAARLKTIDGEVKAAQAEADSRAKNLKTLKKQGKENKEKLKLAQKELHASQSEVKNKKEAWNNAKKNKAELEKTHKDEQAAFAVEQKSKLEMLGLEEKKLQLLKEQAGQIGVLGTLWNNLQGIMLLFKPIYAVILFFEKLINKEKNKQYVATLRQQAADSKGLKKKLMNAGAAMAESAGKIPYVGWIIAAGILTALVGIAIATAVSNAQKYEKSAEGTSEKINDLSNEIYKLNEQQVAIDNITNSFDKLDNKIIKTKEDIESMTDLLKQAAEQMDDDIEEDEDKGFGKGVSERDYYESLSDKGKREYLDQKQLQIDSDLAKKRQEQIDLMNRMDSGELSKFLDENTTSNTIRAAQDAIYALNNQTIYDTIDALKEQGKVTEDVAFATESLTQSMLENLSVKDAYDLVNDPEKIEKLTETIANMKTEAVNLNGKDVSASIAEVLESDDYSLKDKTEAYKEMIAELKSMGAEYAEVVKAFELEYAGLQKFAEYEGYVLDFIDAVGLSNDEINELWGAWEKLQKSGIEITQAEWEGGFDRYLEVLAQTGGDVLKATQEIFGDYLDGSQETLNAFISAYGDLVQVGILNMGQNMDKVQNSINNFYEKALEWNTMSESDKAEFIQDNADLFSDGKLLEAFESGDYNAIEEALANNQALNDQLKKRRQEVEQELLIEEARTGEDRNEAYIAQLKSYKEYLDNTEELFKASLEIRLEQEQNQLDEYKSYLEDQRDALEDSLNKRKEAYEKYFDAISQEEDDEDYEEKANLLISNLSKLGSTSNASAEQQSQKLEQELEKLEEERLKELRERAQEAVLENMEDELSEISEKFDKLLESNQALLAAMKGDLDNPLEFVTNLVSNKVQSGATKLEMEDYIGSLQSTYGSVLGNNVDWDAIQVREENNQLFLTVNGKEIALDTNNEQNLYQAIMKALTEIGLR